MTDRELMQWALEALKNYGSHASNCDYLMLLASMPPQRKPCSCGLAASIEALHARLDGWERVNMTDHKEGDLGIGTVQWDASSPLVVTPHPAFKKPWVGLTDEEISAVDWKQNETLHDFARAIEQALKEKNNG